jgi:hypothetical protein
MGTDKCSQSSMDFRSHTQPIYYFLFNLVLPQTNLNFWRVSRENYWVSSITNPPSEKRDQPFVFHQDRVSSIRCRLLYNLNLQLIEIQRLHVIWYEGQALTGGNFSSMPRNTAEILHSSRPVFCIHIRRYVTHVLLSPDSKLNVLT